jgi:integrase/recombinase XerD
MLTAAEFQRLADAPPEVEWFANLTNAHTRRAYENAMKDFMRFAGVERPVEFRNVTRAHVIACRDDLKTRVTRGESRGAMRRSGTGFQHWRRCLNISATGTPSPTTR